MKDLAELAALWPQLEALLDEALALPAAERKAWLQALPDRNAALKDTLSRLVAAGARVETADFLRTLPKLDGAAAADSGGADAGTAQAGDEVGPYRLLRELGQGGMGSVWLAERADGELQRPVALKLPRLAWARGLVERMARERDILATLEHPHIARLYDAGIDRIGRPWLALELVNGRPIDVFVRERALAVAQRVSLLLQVCDAVAYAHRRLVIHRDLKPGNILVTDDGQVRLLDFGIAKLMHDEQAAGTALTLAAGRALTLDYASPEQVRGDALTTASDVYSLGVVAYEVLTDARPYRLKRGSAAELEEAIALADPPRASDAATEPRARRALRGDLDAILNKALKKHPSQRYPTVDALVQDIHRHLRHEPVGAQPDALAYRATKFLARYRLQVGAASAVGVALAVGLATASDQARRAEQERAEAVRAKGQARANELEARRQTELARAERLAAQQAAEEARRAEQQARSQARRADEVKRYVLALFERADTEAGAGIRTTALELLQQARERIDRDLGEQPGVAFELKSSLARSLGALGDYQGALQLVDSLVGPQAPRVAVPRELQLDASLMRAEWLPRTGRLAEALQQLRELELATRAPGTPRAQRVATMRQLSVALLQGDGAPLEAVGWAERAAQLAAGAADVPELVQLRAWMALANARNIARVPGVLEPATRALRLAQRLYPGHTAEPVLEARQFVALGLAAEGRLRDAVAEYRTLVAARIDLLGPTHPGLAGLYNSMGNAQVQLGDPSAALDTYRALTAVVDAADRGPTVNRAVGRFRQATALAMLRRLPEAVTTLETALAMSDAVGGARNARGMRWRASLAAFQAQAGDLAGAEATLSRVDPQVLADDLDRADAALRASIVRSLQGRHPEALQSLADAERFLAAQDNAATRGTARVALAMANFRAGRAGAERELIEAVEHRLASQGGSPTPDLADLRLAVGRARLDTGDDTGAVAWMRQAEAFWRSFAPEGADAARVQGHLALALATRGERAAAESLAAGARARLSASARADDRQLLAELAGALGH